MKSAQIFTGGKGRSAYHIVYAIQCKTAKIARVIAGDHRSAISMDIEAFLIDPGTAPALCSFRARPQFRSAAAQQLRDDVAKVKRQLRQGIMDAKL